MSESYYLGIDPGLKGAISLIDSNCKVIFIYDYPKNPKHLIKIYRQISDIYPNTTATIEKLWINPKEEAKGLLKKIKTFTNQTFLMDIFGIKYNEVGATSWKSEFKLNAKKGEKLTTAETKQKSLDMARFLFPNVCDQLYYASNDGRAESLLLAEYCRRSSNA